MNKEIRVKLLEGDGTGPRHDVVVLFSRAAYFKISQQDEEERGAFNQTTWLDPLRVLYDWAVYYKFFATKPDAVTYLERFGFTERTQ